MFRLRAFDTIKKRWHWVDAGSQVLRTEKVHIPASAMLTLNESPFTIVPNPITKRIYPLYILAYPDGEGSSLYVNNGGTLTVVGGIAAGASLLEMTTVIQLGSDMFSVDSAMVPSHGELGVPPADLQLYAPGANLTDGDFGLNVTTHYILID